MPEDRARHFAIRAVGRVNHRKCPDFRRSADKTRANPGIRSGPISGKYRKSPEIPVYVSCRSGALPHAASAWLAALLFTNVDILQG